MDARVDQRAALGLLFAAVSTQHSETGGDEGEAKFASSREGVVHAADDGQLRTEHSGRV